MNPTGKTSPQVRSINELYKLKDRIGNTPVQFSMTIVQFLMICSLVSDAESELRDRAKDENWRESETTMACAKWFPDETLRQVARREKVQRFIRITQEIKELNARNQTD